MREFLKGVVCIKGYNDVYELYVNDLTNVAAIEGLLKKRAGDFFSVFGGIIDVGKKRISVSGKGKVRFVLELLVICKRC